VPGDGEGQVVGGGGDGTLLASLHPGTLLASSHLGIGFAILYLSGQGRKKNFFGTTFASLAHWQARPYAEGRSKRVSGSAKKELS